VIKNGKRRLDASLVGTGFSYLAKREELSGEAKWACALGEVDEAKRLKFT